MEHTQRASPQLVGACLLAVAGAALAFAVAVPARGGHQPARPTALASSGILTATLAGGGEAILHAENLAPGHSARGHVTIRYESSGEGRVELSQRLRSESPGLGGGRLFEHLVLTVKETSRRAGRLAYSGPMAAMGPAPLGRFRADESRTYSFVVTMPDHGAPAGPLAGDNAAQGGQVTVDFLWSAGSLSGQGRRCPHGVLGGPGRDAISARYRRVRVLARGGDDRVAGSDAADCIFGGRGDDRLRGRPGGDLIRGGYGEDLLRGGTGRDRLAGRQGDDRVLGGPGSDGLRGGAGNDVIYAADGEPDRIHCGIGFDTAIVDPLDRLSDCERVIAG